jgi:PAS domain S-box-containing protein
VSTSLISEEASPQIGDHPSSSDGREPRVASILILDDQSANRTFLGTVLRHQGHRVREAADGSEGLAAVRAERPDLVITDVLMPVMDGYEFVRQLRLDPANSRIPVVFYTAHYGEREARALALSIGVSDVLRKPADSAQVLKIVGRLLKGELETGVASDGSGLPTDFEHEHLRLITDKLSEKAGDLKIANARLRAVINIGLELASERDADRLLSRVCTAARDLFGATSVTIGILGQEDRRVKRVVACGEHADAWIKTGDSVSGILGTVVAERRTLRAHNPGGDPVRIQLPLQHPEARAFLAAPIASPLHVYGWISLVGNEGRPFSEDDEDLIMALAGQVGRIYEVEQEVAAREKAELDLRQERDRAQRYLDTAEVILLALDMKGRVTLANRYACAVFGWTSDELVGRDFIETCVPSRLREETRQKLGNVLAGPDSSTVDNAIVTRSGEERMIEWRNTLLRDADGRVVSTLSSGTDLTDRNQAVQAVLATEERMRFALEAAGVGIWDMDYSTGVHQWSETLEGLYGIEPGTFAGTFEAFLERIHPDDRESVLDTIGKATKSGADFTVQNRSLWPDGTVRWLSGAGRVLLDPEGKPVRALGITMDITERRALEEQFQQAQKMEAIGRLAGGVAHDFNNLLTVILGNCELLLADHDPRDPRQADIREIQKAGASAARLTRQLLAFSRKQIIEPKLLDLNALVLGIRPMLDRLIGEDIAVVLDLAPQPILLTADRSQMEQIVLNLSVNARDAMPKGGTLTIETARVEIHHRDANSHSMKPGRYVTLSVRDTGTGMTPEVRARLFEPFFTTKEVGKGTGLGLASVHGIVASCGGSVVVDSELGKGASFTVYFPGTDSGETAVEAPPPVARPHSAETVLVVEDEAGLRELARRLLQRQGYTVLLAANAEEALQIFERNASVDVLLTDVVMPGASGPELVSRLMQQRPELKVIYMSGYNEESIVHHGVLVPGIAFLHKPFSAETLELKIAEVLARE